MNFFSQFTGELKYTHYADTYETIDMRAEVGLLTRNILIHGEMGEKCTDVDSDACQAVGFDNFGGHTKAIQGFKAYNIEGAELTNMGQMSVLGSYPIHFHMCHNTTENGQEHPLIQSNSIHHCFRYTEEIVYVSFSQSPLAYVSRIRASNVSQEAEDFYWSSIYSRSPNTFDYTQTVFFKK